MTRAGWFSEDGVASKLDELRAAGLSDDEITVRDYGGKFVVVVTPGKSSQAMACSSAAA